MLSNGMNGPESQNTLLINNIFESAQGGVPFLDYLIVTLLEMESILTILLQVFLKVTEVDFFVYKTAGFIHVADLDFTDWFSYVATGKLLISGEDARKIRQEMYKSLAWFCLLKFYPEFEDL